MTVIALLRAHAQTQATVQVQGRAQQLIHSACSQPTTKSKTQDKSAR